MKKISLSIILSTPLFLITSLNLYAQNAQPKAVKFIIGSWNGTSEVDAFTKKEKIIASSGKGREVVLRCLDSKLSIGFFDNGSLDAGGRSQLSLRVNDEIIGPFMLSNFSKSFAAGALSVADLDKIAKANKEIGYQFSNNGIVGTGGVGGLKTSDLVARLKKSCSGQATITPEQKEKLSPKSNGDNLEKVE